MKVYALCQWSDGFSYAQLRGVYVSFAAAKNALADIKEHFFERNQSIHKENCAMNGNDHLLEIYDYFEEKNIETYVIIETNLVE